MNTEIRCLDETELMYWRDQGEEKEKYNNVEFAIEYEGELDTSAMEKSFRLFIEKYPAFRANVCANLQCDTGFAFYVPEDIYPEFVVLDGDFDTMIDYSKRRRRGLLHSYKETPSLAHLVIVQKGPSQGYVMVGIHHIFVTAAQLTVYLEDLFHIYTRVATGYGMEVDPQPFPLAPERLRENTYKLRENTYKKANNASNATVLPKRRVGCERLIKLNKKASASLIELARNNDVKFSSLIASYMATALRKSYGSEVINPISYGASIDWTVRNKLKANLVTSSVSNHIVRVDVPDSPDSLKLAQEIHEKVADIKPFTDSSEGNFLDGSDISINNGGKLTIPSPNNLELTDYFPRPFIKEWRPPRFNEIVSEPRSNRPRLGTLLYTFNNKLTFLCLLREDTNAAVMNDFIAQLCGEF